MRPVPWGCRDEDGETESDVQSTETDGHAVEDDGPENGGIDEEGKLTPEGSENADIVVGWSPWLQTLDESEWLRDVGWNTFSNDDFALLVKALDELSGFSVELMSFLAIEVRFREEEESNDPDKDAAGGVEVVCGSPRVGKTKHVPCRERRDGGNTKSGCVIRQDGTTFWKLAKSPIG